MASSLDVGGRYGRLTVVHRDTSRSSAHRYWVCQCSCGNLTSTRGTLLTSGATQSCGCLNIEKVREANTKHGHGKTNDASPEYMAWASMWKRCTNPKSKSFKNYGGRGIKVCARWKNFSLFLQDMGAKPAPELTLERIDNDKGYSPNNCAWRTKSEQRKNQRPKAEWT